MQHVAPSITTASATTVYSATTHAPSTLGTSIPTQMPSTEATSAPSMEISNVANAPSQALSTTITNPAAVPEVTSAPSSVALTEVSSTLSQTQSTAVTSIPTLEDVGYTGNDYTTPEPLIATPKYTNTVGYNYTSSRGMDNDTIAMGNVSYEATTMKTGSDHKPDGPAVKIISTTEANDLAIRTTEESVEDSSTYENEYYGEKQFAMIPFVEEIIVPGMHKYLYYIATEWSKHLIGL